MAKFFALAFAALAGCAAATELADSTCAPYSWVTHKSEIDQLNGLLDMVVPSGVLKTLLAPVDPLAVQNKRLDAVPFNVLGVDFTLTPVIQTLNVKGVSTVLPRHLNVTGPSNLDIGADFTGELSLAATVSFEIAQVNHQWWQICWTNILKPKNCPPAIVDVDVAVGVLKPSLATNAVVSLQGCSPYAQAGTCKDFTVNDLILGALSGNIAAALTPILKRTKDLSLASLKVGFDQLTQLNFHFHSSGPVITELGKKLFAFSTKEINKKGDFYRTVIDITNKLGKTLINQIIKDKVSAQFGNSCMV